MKGIALAAAAIAVLLLSACSRQLPPGVTELVYASPYSPNHPFSRADRIWIDYVERRSGGRLRIRPVWSGGLLSSDESMTELRHDVADIGLITPIYAAGGAHLLRVQSGFYSGLTGIEQQVALYRCLATGDVQFAHELEGLHVLAIQGGSLPGIITRTRAVRTLADLRGLRLRAPTELLPVLRQLGADPVNLPMGEVYSEMAKGVLDGVVAPADTLKALHFAEVARFYSEFRIPRGAYPARAMSEARWNTLTPQDRQLLTESTAIWEAALADQNRQALEEGRREGARMHIMFVPVSAADQQHFDRLYLADAASSAANLGPYGIDGPAVFARARRSIGADGQVHCATAA